MYKYFKRTIDFLLSFLAIILLSPLLLIIALWIKLDSKGPAIFKQDRLGLYGKVFKIFKFRTMKIGAEAGGVYEKKGDARVTRVGKLLRKTSLDELPQLVNVLLGDMSLIGPRPPLTYHPWLYEEYDTFQKKMFDVRPGVTGWAQVNGRKEVPWPQRIKLNVEYVENISLVLDIKIFFKTIFKVLKMEDNLNTDETV